MATKTPASVAGLICGSTVCTNEAVIRELNGERSSSEKKKKQESWNTLFELSTREEKCGITSTLLVLQTKLERLKGHSNLSKNW